MTETQRLLISGGSPATGLLVYQTDLNAGFYFYNGANWIWLNGSNNTLADADADTKIQVEETADDDIIRFDLAGTEFFRMNNGRLEMLNTGNSVFIGEGAGANDDLSSNLNVFVGYNAGSSNTTGYYNTANGYRALFSNTIGYSNTASGLDALFNNTEGYNNTTSGSEALQSNTTGSG